MVPDVTLDVDSERPLAYQYHAQKQNQGADVLEVELCNVNYCMRLTITTPFHINNSRERNERRNLLKGNCCEDVISHQFNFN